MFLLVIGALRALPERSHPAPLVLDAFLLRAMSVAGWEPALGACARCGEDGPHRHFSVPAGGSVCRECRPAGSAMPSPITLELDRKSTRLNSSHANISYAVFCLKKKKKT